MKRNYIKMLGMAVVAAVVFGAPASPVPTTDAVRIDSRPLRVRKLLLRLEESEAERNVESAILAIEELRSLPGSPVADLDDKLARRLGDLNIVFLFEMKCPRWVRSVAVKSGDTASRIASEFGSTLASFNLLNGNALDNMEAGQSVFVLNHPRFRLVAHRRTKVADLYLNGKFFKRYDLKSVSGLKEGYCDWDEISPFVIDREELEILLPRNTVVLVSEM